jgi:methionyl-tRNA formyltransferase
MRLTPTPVKRAARELGLATLEPVRLREAVDAVRAARPDLFAVASYGKIVPQAMLDVPPLGALNVHPSLLPLYRGATPLQSQLRDGVADSGVTIIAMDAGMDTGDIVLQERAAIGARETYGELHDRFAELGATLLARACDLTLGGRARPTAQALFGSDADARRTLTRPIAKADLEIDWSVSATAVCARVRSLAPSPGARARFAGDADPIKILASRVGEPRDAAAHAGAAAALLANAVPGTLAGSFVATGSGFVVLERVVVPGRNPMTGDEFARARVTAG